MKSLSKPILLFLLVSSLIACSFPAPATPPTTYEARPTIIWPSATPTPTVTQTGTPTPTLTATATPSATDTPVTPPTLTPTTLPRSLQLRVFEDVWSVVNDNYLYPDFNGVDWEAVRAEFSERIEVGLDNASFYTAMYEMIARLGDEHSSFLSPEDVAQEEAYYLGNYDYVGIGVLHQPIPERQRSVILSVFSASPAEAAGLKPRDAILSADGVPILDEDGYYRDTIRGPAGTTITLTVQTPGDAVRQVTITRQRITGAITLPYQVLTSPNGLRVGYIFLFAFDDSTMDEQVGEALYNMTAEGRLDGLILDLRMNGGGANTIVDDHVPFRELGIRPHGVVRIDSASGVTDWDKDRAGKLNSDQLRDGLNVALLPQGPPPGFGNPSSPGGGPPGINFLAPDGKRNGVAGVMGIDFVWVRAAFEIAGQPATDVDVRWKGNGTFLQSRGDLKRSFKVRFAKGTAGRKLGDPDTLNFHSNVTDASLMNETLAYRLFRVQADST